MLPNLLDLWKLYTKDYTSPDSFIEMSLYSMVSAALQRKVWLQDAEHPIFPNLYIILCGPPGVGKGLVIRPVSNFLRYHKLNPLKNLEDSAKDSSLPKEEVLKILEAAREVRDYTMAKAGEDYEEPMLIPMTAQATTFESLVQVHAKAVGCINLEQSCKMAPNKLYRHSSLCITLEEMSSLFKKQANDLVQYLIAGYDCLEEYKYQTKHMGKDRVKRGCINLLAGTTPKFLQDSCNDKLLDDGFFSRVIVTFEERNRFEAMDIPELSLAQEMAKRDIIARLYEIACLFGQVQYEPDAYAYLKFYTEKEMPGKPINPDPSLEYYYSRKKVHVQKLAMAIHFSRSLDMVIKLDEAQHAIEMLNTLEKKMHLALRAGGRNQLAGVAGKIVRYLKNKGPTSYIELWDRFECDVREDELTEVLKGLEVRNLIHKKASNSQIVYSV